MWQGGSQSFAGDGGFLNTSQFDSPSEAKKENVRKPQNLLSACIGQVLSSPDDSLKIGRIEANLIRVVARVKSVEVSSTKIKYELEDDTGTITAISWLDGDNENSDRQPMVEGIYCRMVGSVRSQEGSRYLMLLQVEPMTNANHLTEHLLAVVHNELAANKQPAVNGNAGPTAGASTSGLAGAGIVKPEPGVGGGINQRVMTFIVGYNHLEAGVGKSDIVKNFQNEISPRQIDEALEFLCNEGQIYTTVDDDHYRSTEG